MDAGAAQRLAAAQTAACLGDLLEGGVGEVLASLEAQHSLLTGMFREFVQQAAAGHAAGSTQAQANRVRRHHQHHQQHSKRARESELELTVTLEELFCGAVKTVPVTLRLRAGAHAGGSLSTVQRQLQVCVEPGLQEGARITLQGVGAGADVDGQPAGDLTFVIHQQLHPLFRRLADDLYAIVDVPLVTALTGGPVTLPTLGGGTLRLPLADDAIITPNSEMVLANQGMPVFGDAQGRRGALHIRFKVALPTSLTPQQQQQIRVTLLGLEHEAGSSAPPLAAAAAAGLLPQPQAGPRLRRAAEPTQQQQQQQQQHEHGVWSGGEGSSHRSSGSSNSTAAAWESGAASASAFAPAAHHAPRAAAGAASHGSSSSALPDIANTMQSTGSSQRRHIAWPH